MTLTAILTSGGRPLAGKTIIFSASLGAVSPQTGITDSEGKVSVLYTAPEKPIKITVSITAIFLGDLEYEGAA
ncbi:MAG: Ig-like domain-containing protein [Candidatus Bathyarchaeia archaeon]